MAAGGAGEKKEHSGKKEVLNKAVIQILNQGSATRLKRGGRGRGGGALEAAGRSLKGEKQSGAAAKERDQEREITVQYNPSGIRYSNSISDASALPSEGAGTGNNVMGGCTRSMSAELVFTQEGPGDESVRIKIDKFLALIMKSPDKRITFSWGDMSCTGKITGLNAVYDAFDPSGNPLHGTVRLTVTQETEQRSGSFDKISGEGECQEKAIPTSL